MRATARQQIERLCVALIITMLASVIFLAQSHRFDTTGRLRIWFFDIGQGDAIFLETPDGHQLLIDGGPSDRVLDKLGSVLWPWDRSLDAIFLTHPHADHVAGLVSVLEQYAVGTIYDTGTHAYTEVMSTFEHDSITERDSRYETLRANETLVYGEVTLRVIAPFSDCAGTYPDDPNEASLVLLLTYHDTTVFLTGDAIESAEPTMAAMAGDIDVLKVGHHGSLTSTSVSMLDAIRPEVAIISVGEDNSYGHPHPVVLSRLRAANIRTYRTDLDGDIFLVSDGTEPVVTSSPLPF